MSVRISTLGGVRFVRDIHELADLPGQRLRCALLIYLAVERKAARETIQNLFWSDRDDEKGRGALKQTVYELRRILGEDCIDSHGDELRIHSRATVDLHDFERAVESKDWQAALAQYGGEFLHGFSLPNCKPFEFWVDRQRAHAARLHRTARRAHISELVRSNGVSAALGIARRWVELEPLEDEAQHKLIELLAAKGERAEALRQADNYERLLRADGLQPLEETKQLVQRLRTGEAIAIAHSRLGFSEAEMPVEPAPRASGTKTNPVDGLASKFKSRTIVVAALVLLLITGLTGAWKTWLRPTLLGRQIRSVAVLPFDNLSANKETTEYQADGFTEALTNSLTQIAVLRVPARTSTFAFKNAQGDIRRIGQALDVDAVLEGSWMVEGTKLRVTARLISVSNGYQVWSDQYDKELRDIFDVQDGIVRDIVAALSIKLGATEAAQLAKRPTDNLEAYNLYQLGLPYFRTMDRTNLSKAVQYFEAATKVDTNFALAYTGLVDTHLLLQAIGQVPRAAACPPAKVAARRALELGADQAEVRNSVARTLWTCDGDYVAADREFRHAIKLNPNLADAHSAYALMLSQVLGRFEEGIEQARMARAIDPLSAVTLVRAANVFRSARLYDSAVVLYQKARAIEQTTGNSELFLAWSYLWTGKWQQAAALLDSAIAGNRSVRLALGYRGYIHAQFGQRERAFEALAELKAMGLRENAWDAVAVVEVGLGEYNRALTALERAAVGRPANFLNLLGEKALDPVRDSTRFIAILDELRIPNLTVRQRDSLALRLSAKPSPTFPSR